MADDTLTAEDIQESLNIPQNITQIVTIDGQIAIRQTKLWTLVTEISLEQRIMRLFDLQKGYHAVAQWVNEPISLWFFEVKDDDGHHLFTFNVVPWGNGTVQVFVPNQPFWQPIVEASAGAVWVVLWDIITKGKIT